MAPSSKFCMNPPSAHSASSEVKKRTPHVSRLRLVAAWAVHAYTASGLLAGFLSLQAIFVGNAGQAFGWMLVAVLIDATDGVLARAVQVKRILPWLDGTKLDDIVDYFTYVIIPIIFLYQFQLLPASGTLLFVAAALLASAYGFCQAEAKTQDFFFTGFPSYWNIVAFYLYTGGTPVWLNGGLVLLLAICVFIPIRYIYPTRTVRLRRLTNILGALWVGVLLVLLSQLPHAHSWLVIVSLYYPLYYIVLSLYFHFAPPQSSSNPSSWT